MQESREKGGTAHGVIITLLLLLLLFSVVQTIFTAQDSVRKKSKTVHEKISGFFV